MSARLPGHVPFPAQRSMSAAWLGPEILIYGGVGRSGSESILDVSSELWIFDTAAGSWRQVQRTRNWPGPRRCPGLVVIDEAIVVWGGSGLADAGDAVTYTFENDLWSFDTKAESWTQLMPGATSPETGSPPPRYFPVLEKTPTGLVLFGGYGEDDAGGHYFGDTWVLEEGKWSPVTEHGRDDVAVGCSPLARYGAASAVVGDSIVIFGGFSGARDLADVWSYSPINRAWACLWTGESTSGPSPRYCPAVAAYEGQLIVFGGRSRRESKRNFSDLWSFDVAKRRWRRLYDHASHSHYGEALAPTYHAKSAYCTGDAGLWLLGGEGLRGHVSDFWRLDMPTMAWELIQRSRPDDPSFW